MRSTIRATLLVVGSAVVASCGGPSDGELAAGFAARRPDLERLRSMSDRDAGVVRVAPDFTQVAAGPDLTPARAEEYRRVFARVGAGVGLYRDDSGGVWVPVWTTGIVGSGSARGYAYLPAPPPDSQVVAALDGAGVRRAPHGVALRPLARQWYAYVAW